MNLTKRNVKIEIKKRSLDKRTGHIQFQFQIGPFPKTFATTVGLALRRSLLSLSTNIAITNASGNLYDGEALREDLFELSLNLQKIIVKSSFFTYRGIGRIIKQGPGIITAGDLQLEEGLEVINPYQYLCTLNPGYPLDLCVMLSSFGNQEKPLKQEFFHPELSLQKNPFIQNEDKIPLASPLELLDTIPVLQQNLFLKTSIKKTLFSKSTLQRLTSLKSSLAPSKKTLKKNKKKKTQKKEELAIAVPQQLPIDFILVDPIYSSIQSCSFEILQTMKSSILEYDELVERGITTSGEFLNFLVISRGAIEPSQAIFLASQRLIDNFKVFELLSNVFANHQNLFISLEKATKPLNFNETTKLGTPDPSSLFTTQILKSLDLRNLDLPPRLELFLRRQGLSTINHLLSLPYPLLKRIGLKASDFELILKSLNDLGMHNTFATSFKWDLMQNKLS